MNTPNNCTLCGATMDSDSLFCSECGAPIPTRTENYCTNPECVNHQNRVLLDEKARFCKHCGKLTTIGKKIEDMI